MRSTRLPSWIERLLGLDPLPVPPHVFSIDERRLRYGRFERREDGVEIADYRSRELPPAFFQSGPLGGPLSNPDALREQVDALLGDLDAEQRQATGRASLVIPDRWLRLVFAEFTELPSAEPSRDEILRFKLRRLVPFRVEELRVRGVEVAPLRGQSEPRRMLLGFAIEMLLAQLEGGFAAAGVAIGQISSASLSLAEALCGGGEGALPTLLVTVQPEEYTLLYLCEGEPLLSRYKALEPALDEEATEGLVGRELRLTRSFLEAHAPEPDLARVVLASAPSEQAAWLEYLERSLGSTPELFEESGLASIGAHLGGQAAAERPGSTAMLGASMREVS